MIRNGIRSVDLWIENLMVIIFSERKFWEISAAGDLLGTESQIQTYWKLDLTENSRRMRRRLVKFYHPQRQHLGCSKTTQTDEKPEKAEDSTSEVSVTVPTQRKKNREKKMIFFSCRCESPCKSGPRDGLGSRKWNHFILWEFRTWRNLQRRILKEARKEKYQKLEVEVNEKKILESLNFLDILFWRDVVSSISWRERREVP